MDVEGQAEVISFLVVAGEPTATLSILLAIGAGLGLFLIIVRAVKLKRDRRKRASRASLEPVPLSQHPA